MAGDACRVCIYNLADENLIAYGDYGSVNHTPLLN